MKRYPVAESDSSKRTWRKMSFLLGDIGWVDADPNPLSDYRVVTKARVSHVAIQSPWNQIWTSQSSKVATILRPDYGASTIQYKFQALVAVWKKATGHLSSPNDIAIHPAYQQIIGMGSDALPLIFQELRDRGGNWYWALKAITGVDPVPETDRGKVQLMKKAWLEWAEGRYL